MTSNASPPLWQRMIVDAAIEGLISGGMPVWEAKNLTSLLERVYNSGYNEARRQSEEIKDWAAY